MGIFSHQHFKIKLVDLSDATSVASGGGTNTQTLQPDAGFIYQVINIELIVPAIAAATGNHYTICRKSNGTTDDDYFRLLGTDGSTYYIDGYGGFTASTENPSAITQQWAIMHEAMWCNNDEYFTFRYTNSSDTNQTGTRTLRIRVKEYPEGDF
jgi:hypothetical protein